MSDDDWDNSDEETGPAPVDEDDWDADLGGPAEPVVEGAVDDEEDWDKELSKAPEDEVVKEEFGGKHKEEVKVRITVGGLF